MKKIFVKSIYTLMFFALFACGTEDIQNVDKQDTTQAVSASDVSQNILYYGSSVYQKSFVDGAIIGYSTMKENPLAEDYFQVLKPTDDADTKNTNGIERFSVTINGIDIKHLSDFKTKSGSSKLYGQEAVFKFTSNIVTKSGDLLSKDTTVTLYIPNLVTITSPKIVTHAELYPNCYYKDFTLKWNADTKNVNGLVVFVEWKGSKVDGSSVSKFVRNIDVVEVDNGQTILNDALFDNIPDGALVYLTLLRGNIEIIDNMSVEQFKVLGESHAVLPLIVIKNLN